MEKITVERDHDRNLTFTGELVASTASSPDRAMGSWWSGETGRWQELRLWRTKSGKFVGQVVNRTQWQGERDGYAAEVCDNHEQVIKFFGESRLAKEIYDEAGIDAAFDLDQVEVANG